MKRTIKRWLAASLTLLTALLLAAPPASAKLHYRGFVEGGIGGTWVKGAADQLRPDNGGGIALGYMLATTHGVQLQNHFFGIGIGITPGYCAAGEGYANAYYEEGTIAYHDAVRNDKIEAGTVSKLCVPIYANWRFDFFNSDKAWRPYFGLKAGIFLPSSFSVKYLKSDFEKSYIDHMFNVNGNRVNYNTYTYRLNDSEMSGESGIPVFISIDAGFRKRITKNSGFSIGISLQTSSNGQIFTRGYKKVYPDEGWEDEAKYVEGTELRLEGNKIGFSLLAKIIFDF